MKFTQEALKCDRYYEKGDAIIQGRFVHSPAGRYNKIFHFCKVKYESIAYGLGKDGKCMGCGAKAPRKVRMLQGIINFKAGK